MILIETDRPPDAPAKEWRARKPALLLEGDHDLCPGCGEPIALRSLLEVIEEIGWADRALASVGIGCYTALTGLLDIDMVQALHGRAPSLATGIKRMRPDRLVFTLQGDGDMVNEGLQEVLHTAARGEAITCVLLNNGVFGETGGHMTATTVLGQRTKNTLGGRDAKYHGHPISMTDLLTPLGGVSYVARGTVTTARDVEKTRRYLRRALEAQIAGGGFSFVEILTMCPTGWFIPVTEGPGYLNETIAPVFRTGEFKVDGVKAMTTIAERSVMRALSSRQIVYTQEVNRLIAACLTVSERTGNFDPRVGDILAEAGLSNQAFYRHFQSKEELLLAVLDQGGRQLDVYLRKRMAAQADPVDKVRAWVRGFTAQAIRPKAAAATRPFMLPSARLYERFPDEIPAVEQLYRDSLTGALELAKAAGQVRPDLNGACDSTFIYDLAKTWLERQLREDPLPPETEIARRADKLEDFIMRAIGVA